MCCEYSCLASILQADTGNISIMQPGTYHLVVTTVHCFTVGGHFYSPLTMSKTLMALLDEHFLGRHITNTHHSHMLIILFKFASYVLELLDRGAAEDLARWCK